ncbi:hypothetical protein DSO57_1029580 [Entomophthora muscae]|uniref:Uncharacterized protein n=1 Tax=Entomophthora muscae TaxID=34485 RepID=A0ACC2S326_9FUNG|nr:hypothetical protein DSO57_1029580 [Entomophthora muscae]
MILIYSLAYVCVSLDHTGVFSYSALVVVTKCGKSGTRLFIGFFFLTVFIGALASNDVVILTLSPLICYLSQALSIDPWSFLIAEFVAANTSSMALYVGNPTNVVVSMAYDISFLKYSQLFTFPFLGAVLVQLSLLLFVYWKDIPKVIQVVEADPRAALVRPQAAIFGGLALFLCIAALVVSSLWHISVWKVTLPFALLVAAFDLVEDVMSIKTRRSHENKTQFKICSISNTVKEKVYAQSFQNHSVSEEMKATSLSFCSLPSPKPVHFQLSVKPAVKTLDELNTNHLNCLISSCPNFTAVLLGLPWGILPFLLGMFVGVKAIQIMGWTQRLASGLVVLFPSSPIVWYLGIGLISSLLCGLLNNLPAAILLAQTLTLIDFSDNPSAGDGAVLGLIAACNLGALLTPAGSLAGLMWRDILLKKNLNPTFKVLWKTIAIIFPLTLLSALLFLITQAQVFDANLI